MSAFSEKHPPELKAAAVLAYSRPGVTAGDVERMAAAGELTTPAGAPIEPAELPANTIRHLARQARKEGSLAASEGPGESPALADAQPRDAADELRRRLITVADRALAAEEAKAPGDVSPAKLTQVARLVREIQNLRPRHEVPLPAPGVRVNGQRVGGSIRGGALGADLLRAARLGEPAGLPPQDQDEPEETEPFVPDDEQDELDGAATEITATVAVLARQHGVDLHN